MYPHIESRDPFFQHHMCLSRNLLYRLQQHMCWASRTPIERVEIRFSNNTCTLRGCSEFSSSASCGLIFRQLHVIDPYVWTWVFVHQSSLSIRPLVFWFYFITLFHFQFWGFSDDKSSARRWFFFRPSASRFLPYMFHVLANVTYLPLLSNTLWNHHISSTFSVQFGWQVLDVLLYIYILYF